MLALLERHWDTLEGDWSIHHHRDLVADVFGPEAIGVRKLRVYIEALPPESATFRAMRSWSDRDEMGATQVELLGDIARSARDLVRVQLPKGKQYPPKNAPAAVEWPRPWVEVEPVADDKPPLDPDSFDAFLHSIAPKEVT